MNTTTIERRPILSLDFDGVLHSYRSGWKGATVIPDPPVPGAIPFLLEAFPHFWITIFSSRSHRWGGRKAMRRWLKHHTWEYLRQLDRRQISAAFEYLGLKTDPAYPLISNEDAALILVNSIKFPFFKPQAFVTLDDRAIQFEGEFPSLDTLRNFKPWNRRENP